MIESFKQRLHQREKTCLFLDKVNKDLGIESNGAGTDVPRSIPLAPFLFYVFAGVNLLPNVLSEPLKIQNREGIGMLRCHTQNMNHFLGNRPMLTVRACLNPFVQAVRHILNVQRGHEFLQNASSMEEAKLTVKTEREREN